MRNVSTKWIGLGGFIAMTVAFAMAGCAGTKEDVDNGGVGGTGTSVGGTSSNVGGSTTAVGGSTTAQGGASSTVPATTVEPAAGVTCDPTVAPGNPLLTDFSATAKTTDGVYSGSKTFTWGDGTKTLTGGSFFYGDAGDAAADPVVPASAVTLEVVDGHGHVTGAIVADKYAGVGLWFGPCTDARAYQGISFSISGDLVNSELQVQVQTSRNYPVDTKNSKGECEGDWGSPCESHRKTFTGLVLTAEAQTLQVPWAELTGGAPITTFEPGEVLGFQWHFNCGPTACNPDVIIDDVTFY